MCNKTRIKTQTDNIILLNKTVIFALNKIRKLNHRYACRVLILIFKDLICKLINRSTLL